MPYDEYEDYCDECGNQGWMWWGESRLMGGTPFRYCDCKYGELAWEKDLEAAREKERQNPYKTCDRCGGSGKVKKDGADDAKV